MLAHHIMTPLGGHASYDGSMTSFMHEHLSLQMSTVLQAPTHACASHRDIIEGVLPATFAA